MNRARLCFAAAMLAALAIAAALRFPRLDLRPMHADEANQAVKAGRLYESGTYEYDAKDHHGPSLYWLTQPALYLSGAKDLAGSSEAAYRIVPVLFGLGLIVLYLLFVDGIGRIAVATAALLTAVSPAMVFYSRYYIQEMLLVFFTIAAIGCSWRYLQTGRAGWILAAGASLGMMHATKETWILSAAAATAAMGLTYAYLHLKSPTTASGGLPSLTNRVPPLRLICHLAAAALVAILIAAALFSMFGKDWHVPLDSIAAYANYFRRGSQGGEHKESWYYYLQILFACRPSKRVFWSEGFIAVLAIVGLGSTLVSASRNREKASPLALFLAFYALILFALYSALSYKTPWCVLSFYVGFILLAGVGAAAMLRVLPTWPLKTLAAVALAAGGLQLAWQAYQLNFNPRYVADPCNPFVYAHTPMPMPRLAERLERFRERLHHRDLTIHVVVKENYWPLPWYLRKFPVNTVYYWLDPDKWRKDFEHFPLPDVLILSADVDSPELAARLNGYNGQVMESLRPGVLVCVYVRNDLWTEFINAK